LIPASFQAGNYPERTAYFLIKITSRPQTPALRPDAYEKPECFQAEKTDMNRIVLVMPAGKSAAVDKILPAPQIPVLSGQAKGKARSIRGWALRKKPLTAIAGTRPVNNSGRDPAAFY
jgi:hypothetical protein